MDNVDSKGGIWSRRKSRCHTQAEVFRVLGPESILTFTVADVPLVGRSKG